MRVCVRMCMYVYVCVITMLKYGIYEASLYVSISLRLCYMCVYMHVCTSVSIYIYIYIYIYILYHWHFSNIIYHNYHQSIYIYIYIYTYITCTSVISSMTTIIKVSATIIQVLSNHQSNGNRNYNQSNIKNYPLKACSKKCPILIASSNQNDQ
jgi:hypothetical protein